MAEKISLPPIPRKKLKNASIAFTYVIFFKVLLVNTCFEYVEFFVQTGRGGQQIDLLRVEFVDGVEQIKGTTFSMRQNILISWRPKKLELFEKLEEFATPTESLEEIFENKEQQIIEHASNLSWLGECRIAKTAVGLWREDQRWTTKAYRQCRAAWVFVLGSLVSNPTLFRHPSPVYMLT